MRSYFIIFLCLNMFGCTMTVTSHWPGKWNDFKTTSTEQNYGSQDSTQP